MDKSVNVDESVAFYVLELAADEKYRGLGRHDMYSVRCGEVHIGMGPPIGVQLEWEVPDRGDLSRDHIPTTAGMIDLVRKYFAGIDWAKIAASAEVYWVPQAWELVAAARVFSDEDVSGVRERIIRAGVEQLEEPVGELQFYGVDILEWPSAWSVMYRRDHWTTEPLDVNEYGLAPTHEAAIEIWQRYLRSSDPDFGSVDLYRFMAVFGCKRLWPPPDGGPSHRATVAS